MEEGVELRSTAPCQISPPSSNVSPMRGKKNLKIGLWVSKLCAARIMLPVRNTAAGEILWKSRKGYVYILKFGQISVKIFRFWGSIPLSLHRSTLPSQISPHRCNVSPLHCHCDYRPTVTFPVAGHQHLLSVAVYTAWWQRHMYVSDLTTVVTWKHHGRESKRDTLSRKSNRSCRKVLQN